MNTTFNNIALFIRRAEEYQTKEFISDAFAINNIGTVKDTTFIKKSADVGRSYNSVIVIFESYNNNKAIQQLLNKMSESKDGTTKFYYDLNRYWIIQVHKQKLPECEVNTVVDNLLLDREKINKLEALVNTMGTQIHYLQSQQERTERTLMEYEHKDTQRHLHNINLQTQIADKELELKVAEDEYKEEVTKLKEENENIKYKLALNAINFINTENQCKKLQQQVDDMNNVLEYVLRQVKEMKYLLVNVSELDPIKPQINSYVAENLY